MKIVYISQGKLFIKEEGKAPEEIECMFAKEAIKTAVRMQEKNEWKMKGRGANFMRGGMLWGMDVQDNRLMRAAITAVTRGTSQDHLLFALDMENCGGIFTYNIIESREQRLFHKEHFYVSDLDKHPNLDLICFSQQHKNGSAHIIVSRSDGSQMIEVTEGDSRDEAPSWLPGEGRQLVLQSAGIARTQQGYHVGTGPFSIQKLDLDKSTLEILIEEEEYDCMLPRMDNEGNLYFIKRPYDKPGAPRISLLNIAKDVFLFPIRLAMAIFHFLNFFSLAFSKKPLTTAGGPKIEGADLKTIMLRGKIINAHRMLSEIPKDGQLPALVPASWELIKKDKEGVETVLATHVVAYDLAPDQSIFYTTGTSVYKLINNTRELLFRDKLIENLALLGA